MLPCESVPPAVLCTVYAPSVLRLWDAAFIFSTGSPSCQDAHPYLASLTMLYKTRAFASGYKRNALYP